MCKNAVEEQGARTLHVPDKAVPDLEGVDVEVNLHGHKCASSPRMLFELVLRTAETSFFSFLIPNH